MQTRTDGSDARRIEVLANGLPLWQGAQAAVDTTLVSPLTRDGAPRPGANRTAGSAVAAAAYRKRQVTYPELAVARRCKLVVVGIEVGGRFGAEAAAFLRKLAVARAWEMPTRLRTATRQAPLHRWMGKLATAAQRALADSLLRWQGSMHAAAPSRLWESCWRMCAAPTTCPAAACLPRPLSAASRLASQKGKKKLGCLLSAPGSQNITADVEFHLNSAESFPCKQNCALQPTRVDPCQVAIFQCNCHPNRVFCSWTLRCASDRQNGYVFFSFETRKLARQLVGAPADIRWADDGT